MFGRRWSAVGSLAGFCVLNIICIPLIHIDLVVTIVGMIGRLFIICGMNTATQLRFKTCVRSAQPGMCHYMIDTGRL